ncbi:four helix bundle protein [Sunxiuqinia dokdonensis]|uniref:30S ribosomal protein S23 n=1 Tax=Sunxiuqinia dokdonensis TaxID=1409788 RepID=A0A0L8VDA3_9BACT|nr:four helix bundle protein [Sunxiuqinia dokdonensis]KOH46132.1 30S ribosomal protein S23 [Sunxiuqinia dokdonensis]
MATIERFEDIKAWQLARDLCKQINGYTLYTIFSKDFKLIGQIKGSSGSVMDNIAEGFERGGNKEFVQFLSFSKGSTGEVKSQLYRDLDNKYISQTEFDNAYSKADEISKMIGGLMSYLSKSDIKGPKFKRE